MNFSAFRITTDGTNFRPEGKYVGGEVEKWIALADSYYGCVTYGYVPCGIYLFDSKQEALDYIKTQYGEQGLLKVEKYWTPC